MSGLAAPSELIEQIDALTDWGRLKALLRQAIMAGSLEEFEQMVAADGNARG